MKKRITLLLTALMCLAGAGCALAGMFDDYYDYQNEDGTYSYYFTQGVTVTMDEDWYRNTIIKTGDDGATFYQKDSYEAYADQGLEGGRLFTIGASVNTDFKDLPSFEYIGFDEENAMNYFAVLPTDYQAYMEDEDIRAGYDALWAGVKDVIAGIKIGSETQDTEAGENTDAQAPSSGARVGGWQVTEDAAVTEEAKAVFDQATGSLLGVNYEPVALLATQVVAGMNYCFLCRSTVVSPDAEPAYKLVYIWKDPAGNAKVIEIQDMEFGLSPADDADGEADSNAADSQG